MPGGMDPPPGGNRRSVLDRAQDRRLPNAQQSHSRVCDRSTKPAADWAESGNPQPCAETPDDAKRRKASRMIDRRCCRAFPLALHVCAMSWQRIIRCPLLALALDSRAPYMNEPCSLLPLQPSRTSPITPTPRFSTRRSTWPPISIQQRADRRISQWIEVQWCGLLEPRAHTASVECCDLGQHRSTSGAREIGGIHSCRHLRNQHDLSSARGQ